MNYQTFLLLSYLLITMSYFFGNDAIRLFLFPLVVGVSVLSFITLLKSRLIGTREIKAFRYFFFLFITTFLVQLFNDNLTPFVVYILSMYPLSLLLLKGKIQSKYIKIPLYLFTAICSAVFLIKGSIYNIFPSMSVNYVSVVYIMNCIVIYMVEKRNNEQVSLHPFLLGFIFSSIGFGRAGIICTGLLFGYFFFMRWRDLSRKIKVLYISLLVIPFLLVILFNYDLIYDKLETLSILERFQEKGVDSPSRDILRREYLLHMDFKNIMLGFNYQKNYWFLHYGLNPHNSYIRLHYYFGFSFFVIVPVLFVALYKLMRRNFAYFVCLFAILLRSWTDSVSFLLLYDFILIALVYTAFTVKSDYENKPGTIKRAF